MGLFRVGRLPFWSAFRVVPVIDCSTCQESRQRRSCVAYSHTQFTRAMKALSLPVRSLPFPNSVWSLGVGVVALFGISDQVGPSALALLASEFRLLIPDVMRAIYIPSAIVRIFPAIRRGATCRYVASVILVAQLVLNNSVGI